MSNLEYLSFPHPRRCPTVAEVTFSKNLVYNLDQEIDEILKEVNVLQNQLQLLQDRLQPLEKRRDNHASYISSFRRLPVEIIEIIVHICLKGGVELVVMTQICGSIRDIVNGMSDIWSSVSLDPDVRYMYDHQGHISCSTTERLDYVLTSTASKELDLKINCDAVDEKFLLPIFWIDRPIRSLFLHALDPTTDIRRLNLDRLNFSLIKRLNLSKFDDEEIKLVMNLCIQSCHQDINLTLVSIDALTLKHELLLRVSHLNIHCPRMNPPESDNIPLPRLRLLKFTGIGNILTLIEASNIEVLDFDGFGQNCDLNMAQSVISQSREALRSIKLSNLMLSNQKPLYFPNLTTLSLASVNIEGSLREYIKALNLKHLSLHAINVPYIGVLWNSENKIQISYERLFSDLFSAQGFPNLETLSISGMPLDGSFATDLEQCTKLWSLKIDHHGGDNFILQLLERIGDKEYLPSLVRIYISCERYLAPHYLPTYSWPLLLGLSYENFVTQFTTKRPGMRILSDVRSG